MAGNIDNKAYFERFQSMLNQLTDTQGSLMDKWGGPSQGSSYETAPSILQGLVSQGTGNENIDREIMFNSEDDYWKSVINERPDLEEAINNIKRFPKEIVGGTVAYQIPIRHDDGTIDEGYRPMNIALQDYDYIFQRTALSKP